MLIARVIVGVWTMRSHTAVALASMLVISTCVSAQVVHPNRPDVAGAILLRSATTSVIVNGGLRKNGLVPYGGLFRYHDHSHQFEETTWSVDPVLITAAGNVHVLSRRDQNGFAAPKRIHENLVRCLAEVDGIEVAVDFELLGSNAVQTFRFRSPNNLYGSTFLYYAENDLFGHANDIAAFTGSLQGDDLNLYMFDSQAGGLSVKLSGEGKVDSTLRSFGAGVWTKWGTDLERGDLSSLSADGSSFSRYGDTGLALAFDLTGKEPVVVINYDSQPKPPDDPKSLRYLETASHSYPADSSDVSPTEAPDPSAEDKLRAKVSWHMATGRTLQAGFVGINRKRKTVILRNAKGRVFSLRFAQLHEDEQELLASAAR